jgi:hypothetical protein
VQHGPSPAAKGSNEWNKFEGQSLTVSTRGIGMQMSYDDLQTGQVGLAPLIPDHRSVIYWASSTTPRLDTPMIGKFENGGEFYVRSHDKACLQSLIWSRSPKLPAMNKLLQWRKTWKTVMEFTRRIVENNNYCW